MRKLLTENLVAPLTLMSTGCMGSTPDAPHWQGTNITVFDCMEWADSVDLYGVTYSEDCLEWAEQSFMLPYLSSAFSLVAGIQFFLDFDQAYAAFTQIYTYRLSGENPIGYSYSSFFQYTVTENGYDLLLGENETALSCHFEGSLLYCQGLGNNVYNANFSFEESSEPFAPEIAFQMFN